MSRPIRGSFTNQSNTQTHTIMQGSKVKSAIAKAIDGVTRYIGGLTNYVVDLNVRFNNTVTASTNYERNDYAGKIVGTVSLPVVDDVADVKPELYEKLIAYTAHEILHPLLTNIHMFAAASRQGYGDLLNCAEDVFIEAYNRRANWQSGAVPMLGRAMARLMDVSKDKGWHPGDPESAAWTLKCLGYVTVVQYPELQRFKSFIYNGLIQNPVLHDKITAVLVEVDRSLTAYSDCAVTQHEKRTTQLLEVIVKQFPKNKPLPELPPQSDASEGNDAGDDTDDASDDAGVTSDDAGDDAGDDASNAGDDTGDDTDDAGDTGGVSDDADADDADADDAKLPSNPLPQGPRDLWDDTIDDASKCNNDGLKKLASKYGKECCSLYQRQILKGVSVIR